MKKLGVEFDSKKFLDGCKTAKELTGSGTSAAALLCKPRKSKSFFFGSSPSSSAPSKLAENDADEETAEAVKAIPQQASLSYLPQHTKPSKIHKAVSKKSASPSKSPSASTDTAVGTNAKVPHFKDLYHYYLDNDGFEYKITLVRSDYSTNSFARYHIGLLESHTKPHTYCTVVQFTPPAKGNGEQGAVTARHEVVEDTLKRMLKKIIDSNPAQASNEAFTISSEHEKPFKSLICPMNSDYVSAFRAFRYAFRDITLLAWEDRIDHGKVTQKARAKEMGIEPFVYSKPATGLPIGLFPQIPGIMERNLSQYDDMYQRDAFSLPSISFPLSKHGAIGAALYREDEELRRKEEEDRLEAEKAEREARRKKAVAGKKRAEYNKPFFSGHTGQLSAGR